MTQPPLGLIVVFALTQGSSVVPTLGFSVGIPLGFNPTIPASHHRITAPSPIRVHSRLRSVGANSIESIWNKEMHTPVVASIIRKNIQLSGVTALHSAIRGQHITTVLMD